MINVTKKTKSSMIENSGADEEYLRLDSLNNFSKRVAFELYLNNEEAKHTKHREKEKSKRSKCKVLEIEISEVDVWVETRQT